MEWFVVESLVVVAVALLIGFGIGALAFARRTAPTDGVDERDALRSEVETLRSSASDAWDHSRQLAADVSASREELVACFGELSMRAKELDAVRAALRRSQTETNELIERIRPVVEAPR